METRVIRGTIHGRYLLARPEGDQMPRVVVAGFHGYGENALRHLTELEQVRKAAPWLLVAVDSLHRFYHHRTQEVIGSWMTREGREVAIEDNVRYVTDVLTDVATENGTLPLVCVGFSQGSAMAYRTAASQPACAAVAALGGDLPPDVDPARLRDMRTSVLIGRNRNDAWYTEEKLAADEERLRNGGVAVQVVRVEGQHEWNDEFRARAAQFIAEVAPLS